MRILHIGLMLLSACNIVEAPKSGAGGVAGNLLPTGPDPLAELQWHLRNTGQTNFTTENSVAGMDVNLSDVHDEFTGAGVTIVVSDGRIELNHEDLTANADRANSRNYLISSPYLGEPDSNDDEDAHGTLVMGIIGAAKDNGRGGFGVAPGAKLIGANFIASSQTLSQLLDQGSIPGGQVYNYSYGYYTCEVTPARGAFVKLIRAQAHQKQTIYVSSSGNDYSGSGSLCGMTGDYYGNANLDQTKSYPQMVVVGATTAAGVVTSYSTPGTNVWITAPGGGVGGLGIPGPDLPGCDKGYATDASTGTFDSNGNGLNTNCSYSSTSVGTSFSSPIVTGGVALLKQVDPSLNWREIKHILAMTARKLNPSHSGWTTNGAGIEFHPGYGFGQLDLKAATEMARSRSFDLKELRYTVNDFSGNSAYASGTVNLAIPDYPLSAVSSTIAVDGHNLIVEHVLLKLQITHTSAQDLEIKLRSPSGTTATVLRGRSGIADSDLYNVTFGVNTFYGERSQGTWTLTIEDQIAVDTGSLVNWSVLILGNGGDDPSDTEAPDAPTSVSHVGNTLSWVASLSPDLLRYEGCVVSEAGSLTLPCRGQDWVNLGTQTNRTFTHFDGDANFPIVSGRSYRLRLRAVDTSENGSIVAEYSWSAP